MFYGVIEFFLLRNWGVLVISFLNIAIIQFLNSKATTFNFITQIKKMVDIKEFEKKDVNRKVDISDVLITKDTNKWKPQKPSSKYQISNELDKYENSLIKKRKIIEN